MKDLELNACKLVHEKSIAAKFDLGNNVRLVSPFNESEVDKYFESVSKNLKWPTGQWDLLLHSVLKGKPKRHIQFCRCLCEKCYFENI